MKKSQKHILYAAICGGITLALIVAVVFSLVRENRETPNETRPPVTDTGTTAPEESTTPNIPDITPSDNEGKTDMPGDVTLDVEGKGDETRSDEPHIDGDVVIIPGVKGEDE